VVAKTFEEASAIRKQYPVRVPRSRMLSDSLRSMFIWHALYFGIEPLATIRNWMYQRKLKRAISAASVKG
jgi:hypothetical protein